MDHNARKETPVMARFLAWLDAFNTGNRETLLSYHNQHFDYKVVSRHVTTIDSEERVSNWTGGFDIKKYQEQPSPTVVTIIMKERRSWQFARATMEVDSLPPHPVIRFEIDPIGTPVEFLGRDDPKPPGPLDESKRKRLIERIASEIQTNYVFPDVGEKMVAEVCRHLTNGDYDSMTEGERFADTVTEHLRNVSHDLHLRFFYGPSRPPPKDETPAERLRQHRRMNFDFGRIDRLEGNIARLVIYGFVHLDEEIAPGIREGIGQIMSQVADAAALLLDLRENGGGDPATVALVASYLFDSQPVHLNDIYYRNDNSTKEYWTSPEVPGARFGGRKPIYVLTSKDTFSGGEELAYDLQCLRRATVIGETTGGGANPSDGHEIDDWFHIVVPVGRPINPVTKTNWEGIGVVPEIAVPATYALEEGRRRAVEDIWSTRTPGRQ